MPMGVLLAAALFVLVWSSPAAAQEASEQYAECVDDYGDPGTIENPTSGKPDLLDLTDEFKTCLGNAEDIRDYVGAETGTWAWSLGPQANFLRHAWLISESGGHKTWLTWSGHRVRLQGATVGGEVAVRVSVFYNWSTALLVDWELTGRHIPPDLAITVATSSPPALDMDALGLGWCKLPGDLVDHCEDPVELLPMWRWSRTTHIWTDWGGNVITSTIRAVLGGSFDMLVSLQFFVAAFVWDVLARLLYLALSADFTKDLLVGVDKTYYHVMHNLIDSGLFWLVAVVGFLAACWALFRKGAEDAWRTLLSSIFPLGLAMFMLIQISTAYDPGSGFPTDVDNLPDYGNEQVLDTSRTVTSGGNTFHPLRDKYLGTPSWMFTKLNIVTDELGDGLATMATSLTGDRTSHSSYCSMFSHQLERLYLQTVLDKRIDDGEGNSLQPRDYSPIALSRLWERAYLAGWSQAQFGSPQAAHNGSCLWAEANTPEVIPPETLTIWAATCDGGTGSSTTPDINDRNASGLLRPLYGCAGGSGSSAEVLLPTALGAGEFLTYGDESRAWRTFRPDNEAETRSFLLLASACGLTNTNNLGRTVDGKPNIPTPLNVDIDGNGNTVALQNGFAYIEAR